MTTHIIILYILCLGFAVLFYFYIKQKEITRKILKEYSQNLYQNTLEIYQIQTKIAELEKGKNHGQIKNN